jgi:hypothetical protein
VYSSINHGAALWWGLWPGIVAAIASVLAFDFFFVPPYYTFAVRDIQYLITLFVLLAVALLVGTLAARLRRWYRFPAKERRPRSQRLAAPCQVSRLASAGRGHNGSCYIFLVRICLPHNGLEPVVSQPVSQGRPRTIAVATGRAISQVLGTARYPPDAPAIYLPRHSSDQGGVLAQRRAATASTPASYWRPSHFRQA